MQIVSCGDNLHVMSKLFLRLKKKNIINLASNEYAQRVLKVKEEIVGPCQKITKGTLYIPLYVYILQSPTEEVCISNNIYEGCPWKQSTQTNDSRSLGFTETFHMTVV